MGLVIHTSRLTLQALSVDLFPHLHHANYFPAHLDAHLQRLKMKSSAYGWGPWIIYLRDSTEVIGDIGFKGEPDTQNTVEIGYGIRKNYRLKGFATEALEGLLHYSFHRTETVRVTAHCRYDNQSSIRVLEKVSMHPRSEELQMIYWQLTRQEFLKSQRNQLVTIEE
ncbi:GNAT family N-acetyltransferase [Alkalicoccus daliensis]|uniref:Ribosomal-protein-alanine N-acetyltransferase n=1 Tax=Alkalicoccus daliensis TaxID=745820 RepID=A0A1H0ISC0_9BACI|nr:GNAT family N-acetyltransferase [Alkalicoccus daliensis]SDO34160.1 ribosomal-protein-alanine N-acetyltransferase [Alkalicoccus daliensis]